MEKNYNPSLDILRIIAAFFAVLMTVSGKYIGLHGVETADYAFSVGANAISQIAMPLFVMISGALMLSPLREIDYRRIWLHNILRIVIVFFVWNVGYYIFASVLEQKYDFLQRTTMDTLSGIVQGGDHLWYLGAFVGLYAMTPIIKTWLSKASKQNVEYFLFMFIWFQVFRDTFVNLFQNALIDRVSDFLVISELTGYVGYFILGNYLMTYELPKNMKKLLFISFPLYLAINALFQIKKSRELGMHTMGISGSFGAFTFLAAIALFEIVISINLSKLRLKSLKLLRSFARNTLGVFLMSEMLVEFLITKGMFMYLYHSYIWTILVSVAVMLVTSLVAAAFRKIPFAGRYIC